MGETPQKACSCGTPFTKWKAVGNRIVWWYCPRCDAHGSGCINHNHDPGKCIYE